MNTIKLNTIGILSGGGNAGGGGNSGGGGGSEGGNEVKDTWRYFNVSNVNPYLIEDTFIPSLVKTSDGILSTSTYDGWNSDIVLAVAVDGEMLLSNDNGELVTWNELTNMTQEKLTQLGATEITKEEFYK